MVCELSGCAMLLFLIVAAFTVPTGNFGDIYAGFVAGRMGLPIDNLIIATNENDILVRTLASGKHRLDDVKPTITPSMDIQISSNFERLLFEVSGRQPETIRGLMQELKRTGGYTLDPSMREVIAAHFDAGAATEAETLAEIARAHAESSYLSDPHTAVALHVARRFARPDIPMITLSTAHPAKFTDAVQKATGQIPHPPSWAEIAADRPEDVTLLENDQDMVEAFILKHSRLRFGHNHHS